MIDIEERLSAFCIEVGIPRTDTERLLVALNRWTFASETERLLLLEAVYPLEDLAK